MGSTEDEINLRELINLDELSKSIQPMADKMKGILQLYLSFATSSRVIQEFDIPTQPDQPSESLLFDELDIEIEAEMAAEAAREKAKAAERTAARARSAERTAARDRSPKRRRGLFRRKS